MILVSACLVGERCRYDGGGFDGYLELQAMVARGEAVPVCPEVLGGLGTPRPPAEIQGGDGEAVLRGAARLRTQEGQDVTEAFLRGAEATAALAREVGATGAILKARSPSCGVHAVYDGSFQGQTRPGPGVTAAWLAEQGLALAEETDPRPA